MIGADERYAAEEVHHLVRSFTPPLLIERTPITVAGVFRFFGSELGARFDPGKTYRVLRPPAVLAGAAKRSARLQIFDRHPKINTDVLTEDERAQFVVGHASGLSLAGLSLFARVVIWRPDAIAAIKRGKRSALSISYRQHLTIEGGRFNGDRYDAIAHEIELSNIALVETSRAGDAVRIRWSDHAEQ